LTTPRTAHNSNSGIPCPYQAGIPADYQHAERCFRLDTALDSPPRLLIVAAAQAVTLWGQR